MMARTIPQIAITDFSTESPIGFRESDILENLKEGHSGIRLTTVGDRELLMGRLPEGDRFSPANRSMDMAHSALNRLRELSPTESVRADIPRPNTGVVMGSSKGLPERLFPSEFSRGIPDFSGDNAALELARTLQAEGPALNYPTACATGIVCLIQGSVLIERGIANEVFAGATEACAYPLFLAGFKNMGALSLNPMRPFQPDRDGFNPGEGAAVFRLESLGAPGQKPVAVLRGWDYRADAYHMTAVNPDGKTLAYCIRKTLERAGWNPQDVEYINAHGTGTPVNDDVEARAIADVFGANCPPVSSLKPYIGHLLGASGAVELALIITALRNGFIPPTLTAGTFDPTLPIRHVPVDGIHRPVKRFLKLSLGFGGHIAALAVEMV